MLERKAQKFVGCAALWPRLHDLETSCLQKLSVLNAGRASRFARATPETAVYVSLKRSRSARETTFFDRAHEVDASARPIVFVGGSDICGTRFETQPAMNAGENFLFFARENRRQR